MQQLKLVRPQKPSAVLWKQSQTAACKSQRSLDGVLHERPSVTDLVELLLEQVPLVSVGFAELLLVPDEQRQLADGAGQQVLGVLLHQLTEDVRLQDQHSPRLVGGAQRNVSF